MSRQTVTFVLDTERDRDIVRWLEAQENKSAAIREAIREHQGRSTVTLADVYEAVLELRQGHWVLGPETEVGEPANDEEPPDVAAALDGLGV